MEFLSFIIFRNECFDTKQFNNISLIIHYLIKDISSRGDRVPFILPMVLIFFLYKTCSISCKSAF